MDQQQILEEQTFGGKVGPLENKISQEQLPKSVTKIQTDENPFLLSSTRDPLSVDDYKTKNILNRAIHQLKSRRREGRTNNSRSVGSSRAKSREIVPINDESKKPITAEGGIRVPIQSLLNNSNARHRKRKRSTAAKTSQNGDFISSSDYYPMYFQNQSVAKTSKMAQTQQQLTKLLSSPKGSPNSSTIDYNSGSDLLVQNGEETFKKNANKTTKINNLAHILFRNLGSEAGDNGDIKQKTEDSKGGFELDLKDSTTSSFQGISKTAQIMSKYKSRVNALKSVGRLRSTKHSGGGSMPPEDRNKLSILTVPSKKNLQGNFDATESSAFEISSQLSQPSCYTNPRPDKPFKRRYHKSIVEPEIQSQVAPQVPKEPMLIQAKEFDVAASEPDIPKDAQSTSNVTFTRSSLITEHVFDPRVFGKGNTASIQPMVTNPSMTRIYTQRSGVDEGVLGRASVDSSMRGFNVSKRNTTQLLQVNSTPLIKKELDREEAKKIAEIVKKQDIKFKEKLQLSSRPEEPIKVQKEDNIEDLHYELVQIEQRKRRLIQRVDAIEGTGCSCNNPQAVKICMEHCLQEKSGVIIFKDVTDVIKHQTPEGLHEGDEEEEAQSPELQKALVSIHSSRNTSKCTTLRKSMQTLHESVTLKTSADRKKENEASLGALRLVANESAISDISKLIESELQEQSRNNHNSQMSQISSASVKELIINRVMSEFSKGSHNDSFQVVFEKKQRQESALTIDSNDTGVGNKLEDLQVLSLSEF